MNITAYEAAATSFAAYLRTLERAESTIIQYLREVHLFAAWVTEGGESRAGILRRTGTVSLR